MALWWFSGKFDRFSKVDTPIWLAIGELLTRLNHPEGLVSRPAIGRDGSDIAPQRQARTQVTPSCNKGCACASRHARTIATVVGQQRLRNRLPMLVDTWKRGASTTRFGQPQRRRTYLVRIYKKS